MYVGCQNAWVYYNSAQYIYGLGLQKKKIREENEFSMKIRES